MVLIVASLAIGFVLILRRLRADLWYAIDTKNAVALYEHNERAWEIAKERFQSDIKTVTDLEQSVVTTDTVPTFLSNIEALSGPDIKFNISSVSTTPIGGTPALSITFSALGSKQSVQGFLLSLEHIPQQIRLNSFSFSEAQSDDELKGSKPKTTQSDLWRATVTMQVLSYIQ
jgi:hypothetical protein